MKKLIPFLLLCLSAEPLLSQDIAPEDQNSERAKGDEIVSKGLKISVKTVEGAPKILYVTHEPGQWHDYTGQRKVFEELVEGQDWTVDVLTSSYDGLLNELSASPEFAKGYDVVIYNVCVAEANNLMAAYNILKQTQEYGVDSLLIHGALHSFWRTFTDKYAKKAESPFVPVGTAGGKAAVTDLDKWKSENPELEFPVWGDFCGNASMRHSHKSPIAVEKKFDHPAVAGVPQTYVTSKSELYLTHYKTENLQEILIGSVSKTKKSKKKDKKQNDKKNPAGGTLSSAILWEHDYGKGSVMGFTPGHYTSEWKDVEFQSVLIGSINYLAK